MKELLLLVLVFLCSATGAFAQGRPDWIAKFEETAKAKEPSWKASDRIVNDQGASYSEGIKFTKGSVTGLVNIISYSILENPEETFQGYVTVRDSHNRKGERKVKLAGLGDWGYIWAGPGPNDFAEVLFKKGSTFVTVFLPGRATAERFARHVASLIP